MENLYITALCARIIIDVDNEYFFCEFATKFVAEVLCYIQHYYDYIMIIFDIMIIVDSYLHQLTLQNNIPLTWFQPMI